MSRSPVHGGFRDLKDDYVNIKRNLKKAITDQLTVGCIMDIMVFEVASSDNLDSLQAYKVSSEFKRRSSGSSTCLLSQGWCHAVDERQPLTGLQVRCLSGLSIYNRGPRPVHPSHGESSTATTCPSRLTDPPRRREDEPHLHEVLQHAVRLPSGAAQRQTAQRLSSLWRTGGSNSMPLLSRSVRNQQA